MLSARLKAEMADPRIAGAAISALLGTIVLASVVLVKAPENIPLCLFHAITGLPCPSCGMTRAFIALGHADIRSALYLNPSSLIIYAAAWVGLVLGMLQTATRRKYIEKLWLKSRNVVFPMVLAIMGASWAYNLYHHFL